MTIAQERPVKHIAAADAKYWASVRKQKAEKKERSGKFWAKQKEKARVKAEKRECAKQGIQWMHGPMPEGIRYNAYIESKWWKRLRKKKLRKDKHRCFYCGKRAWQCHHVKYPKDFRFDCLANLRSTCGPCHMVAHGLILPASLAEDIADMDAHMAQTSSTPQEAVA